MSDLRNVKGLDELNAIFRDIPIEAQKRVLRKGASAGARYVRDAVKAAAPTGKGPKRRKGEVVAPGLLKKSAFYFFKRSNSNAGQAVFVVSFRKEAFYQAWVNNGHRIVPRARKSAAKTLRIRRRNASGTVPPHPFFEQAVTAAANRALEIEVEVMGAEMSAIIAEKT